MGSVVKKEKKPKTPRVSFRSDADYEDAWQRRATAAAVAAVRQVIADGVIPPGTPIGRLGEVSTPTRETRASSRLSCRNWAACLMSIGPCRLARGHARPWSDS
jgi:hypothetical protein